MLFTSLPYVGYFFVVFITYYLLPHRFRWVLLLLASYVYYAFNQPAYGLLLLGFTGLHYYCAKLIYNTSEPRLKKVYLSLGIGCSLAVLFFFKYYNFFAAEVLDVLHALGKPQEDPGNVSQWLSLNVILPIGISFYTFQTLSYTIDVYYGKIKPQLDFGRFALFVSYFPQLVIGPVERADSLMPQLEKRVVFNYLSTTSGLRLVLWGFFKKLAIADRLGELLHPVFNDVGGYDTATLWMAFLLFPIQMYADFSGYTDIARGCSRMLGINLSINFDAPLFARSVTEFWRKWNMTISAWFRDYVFYPLYLKLKHAKRIKPMAPKVQHNFSFVFSLTVMFLLLGIWHGADWQFMVLGVLQALFIIIETYVHIFPAKAKALYPLQIAKTYLLFCVTALLFRSIDLDNAVQHFAGLFGQEGKAMQEVFHLSKLQVGITFGNIGLMLFTERAVKHIPASWLMEDYLMPIRWVIYLSIITLLGLTGVFHESIEFIYMKF